MSTPAVSFVPSARLRLDTSAEDFLARLTDAAYRVSLKHGFSGSFVDLQLELWSTLRNVVARQVTPRRPSAEPLPTEEYFS
jgi:hypothetical protein